MLWNQKNSSIRLRLEYSPDGPLLSPSECAPSPQNLSLLVVDTQSSLRRKALKRSRDKSPRERSFRILSPESSSAHALIVVQISESSRRRTYSNGTCSVTSVARVACSAEQLQTRGLPCAISHLARLNNSINICVAARVVLW